MAIRKDLDDMLRNLENGMNGTGSVPDTKKEKIETVSAPPRKSVYDDMSVDDLLSALSDTGRSEAAEELSAEFSGMRPLGTDDPGEEAYQQPAESVAVPAAEEFAPEPEPVPVPKKKKKIVITGELPDYEAIRQRELEKDRLAREAAEAEKWAAEKEVVHQSAPESEELMEVPAEELQAAAVELVGDDLQFSEPVSVQSVPTEPESVKEEKQKKGFFSKIKEKLASDELAELAASEPEMPAEAPVQKDELDDLIAEAEADSAASIYQPAEENVPEEVPAEEEAPAEEAERAPTADELLDAALAAIHNATASGSFEDTEAAAEELSAEFSGMRPWITDSSEYGESAPEAESDPSESIIEGMREDAANAVAELEKPAAEKEEAEKQETPDEKPAEEVKKEPEETPKKKNVLERILDEDPDELLSERSERAEGEELSAEKSSAKFKKRLYTVLGAVFSVFALIGIIFVGAKCVSGIRRFASGEVKKEGFTEVVYPAVIMDIESFNDPSELSSENIITAAIWAIIMDEDSVSKYTVNPGTDTISIPYMDVEAKAVEMFGTDHQPFEHCTVGPVDSRFFYSEGAYNVKLRTITFTYYPEIKSIVKSGSDYTVKVDYVDELPEWMEKNVSKSVEFKLTERDDGTYCMNSMKIEYIKSTNL
jgi:hypothetical protein